MILMMMMKMKMKMMMMMMTCRVPQNVRAKKDILNALAKNKKQKQKQKEGEISFWFGWESISMMLYGRGASSRVFLKDGSERLSFFQEEGQTTPDFWSWVSKCTDASCSLAGILGCRSCQNHDRYWMKRMGLTVPLTLSVCRDNIATGQSLES